MAKAKSRKSTSSQRREQRTPQSSTTVNSNTSTNKASPERAQASPVSPAPRQARATHSVSTSRRPQPARSQSQRANERRRARSNSRPAVTVGIALLIIAVIVGIFLYISHQSTGGNGPVAVTPVSSGVLKAVTTVDPTELAAVGTGGVTNAPKVIHGQPPLKGPAGKPEFFYFGAEYCPYCAAQRWSMVVALSRFGTFSHLNQTTSSATDVDPSTPTFTFYQSSYSSAYVDFVSVESTTNQPDGNGYYVTLQTPTAAQQQLVTTYDAPPYVSQSGAIPFIDIANQYLVSGPGYDPKLLSGLDWSGIANELSIQDSLVAKGILGTANYLTAAICMTTNQQPASVCSAAPIPSIEGSLGKASVAPAGAQLAFATGHFEAIVRRSGGEA